MVLVAIAVINLVKAMLSTEVSSFISCSRVDLPTCLAPATNLKSKIILDRNLKNFDKTKILIEDVNAECYNMFATLHL